MLVHTFPPNIAELKKAFPINETTNPIFTYGDTIHAPYHEKVPDDVVAHEQVHVKQQKQYTSPDVWWNKYTYDRAFRKSQEIEAYGVQYQWIKERLGNKVAKEALFELASSLSGELYQLNMTFGEAEVAIKRYGKSR